MYIMYNDNMYVRVFMCLCVSVRACVCMRVHVYVRVFGCVCIHACVYPCMHPYLCPYILLLIM